MELPGQALGKNKNVVCNGIRYICDSHLYWRDPLNPGEAQETGTVDQNEKSRCFSGCVCSCSHSPKNNESTSGQGTSSWYLSNEKNTLWRI